MGDLGSADIRTRDNGQIIAGRLPDGFCVPALEWWQWFAVFSLYILLLFRTGKAADARQSYTSHLQTSSLGFRQPNNTSTARC